MFKDETPLSLKRPQGVRADLSSKSNVTGKGVKLSFFLWGSTFEKYENYVHCSQSRTSVVHVRGWRPGGNVWTGMVIKYLSILDDGISLKGNSVIDGREENSSDETESVTWNAKRYLKKRMRMKPKRQLKKTHYFSSWTRPGDCCQLNNYQWSIKTKIIIKKYIIPFDSKTVYS